LSALFYRRVILKARFANAPQAHLQRPKNLDFSRSTCLSSGKVMP